MTQKDAVDAEAVADGADAGASDGSATAGGRPLRSVVWRLLPRREAVPRWVRRLLTAALAAPLVYWTAVGSTALGTMAGRRAGLVGRLLRRGIGGVGRRVGAAARTLRRDHPKRGPSAPPRDRPRL